MNQRQLHQKPRRPRLQSILAMLTLAGFAVGFWLVGGTAKHDSTSSMSFVSPPSTPQPSAQPEATATGVSMERATRQALVRIELTDTHLHGTALPPGTLKPTPLSVTSATPVPTGLSPFPLRTPLGAGALAPIAPPFSPMQFRVTNAWYVDLDGMTKRTVVYAGAEPEDDNESGQGGVVVYVWQLSGRNNRTVTELVETGAFLAPERVGSLEIIDEEDQRLTLQSEDGRIFVFDVPARRWESGEP